VGRRAQINALLDVHDEDPEFGYRFLVDELHAAGEQTGERRAWRLCSQQRIWSTTTKKGRRGSGKTPGPAVHDDLVERKFTAVAPNLLWLTDITEHPTVEGKLYCCAIKDVFSNRIVGYACSDRMTRHLAVRALRAAIARRQPHGTVIVHSDRGSQGGFNWSSQHLDLGKVLSDGDGGLEQEDQRCARCGAPAVACRSGVTAADAVARTS
jgi:transposase InsO family protein